MPHNEFRYVAAKKFVAGHPPGSGIEVTYEIGDDVPAGDWGRAAAMMVESGKIDRLVIQVADPGDEVVGAVPGSPAASTEKPAHVVNAETDPLSKPDPRQGHEWPKRTERRGFYVLSDGSEVYGENKAVAAQEALEAPQPVVVEEAAADDSADPDADEETVES